MPSAERLIVEGLARLPQFSHAGLSDDLVFVSGTLGTDSGGLVGGGVGPQTTQALLNIGRILLAAGSGWDDVVKVSVYVADMAGFGSMNAAYDAFFPGPPPARITVGGVRLALDAEVEIECIARRSPPSPPSPPSDAPRIARHTGFISRDGEKIYYEVSGEGGVPLVLSHGAGGNHAVWYQQVAPFAAEGTVVAWDHRGFGRSTDRAGRSGPEVSTGDLLALLDHLGIERADLVGQSLGGWTTVGVALARPGLARSLVLADTLGGFTSDAIAAALDPSVATHRPDPSAPGILGSHPALGTGFSVRHPERAHLYQSLGQMGSADLSVIFPRLLATTHDREEASHLTMPVLCLVGDRDPLFPPAAVRALAGMLPDARVVEIAGCGHSPYFEEPEAWNAAVRHFLATVERA